MSYVWIAFFSVLGLVLLVAVLMLANFGVLWLQAFFSGCRVSFASLLGMSLRNVKPATIVKARIMARQAGLEEADGDDISITKLENHVLAGGNVVGVVLAIIAANRADIRLGFDRAAAIDLAGRDVLDAVKTSVYPRVISCPSEGSERKALSAISKDGIELKVIARVTVRTNLDQLIGGATEETVIARVGEGIITSIGSSERHMDVMGMPDQISRMVLEKGLESNTAFEVVSIDIADISIGQNIGARLQADQAEADTRVARASAEKRRANAIAQKNEMTAEVVKRKSELVEAESHVPKAMAQSIVSGQNLSSDPNDEFWDRFSRFED